MKTRNHITSFLALLLALLPVAASGQDYPAHSVLSAGSWYKLAFNKGGVCRLTVSSVAELSGVEFSKIAVFGNGGALMPMLNSVDRPNDLLQVATSIYDQNGNGRMDAADHILFYVEGPDLWNYNPQTGGLEHQRHPYSLYNYYYLTTTFDGVAKRVPTADSPVPNRQDITSYTSVAFVDNDLLNTLEAGQIWVGEKFTATTPTRSFTLTLPGVVSGSQLRVRAALASVSGGNAQFSFSLGGTTKTLSLNDNQPYAVLTSLFAAASSSATFNITYSTNQSQGAGYLDYIELNGTSPLTFHSGQNDVYNLQHLGEGGVARFVVSGATAAMRVWDVSRHDSVVEMSLARSGSTASFTDSVETVGHYILFDGNGYISPVRYSRLEHQDLHGEQGADLVILTHPSFVSHAQELANLHLIYDGISSFIVTPEKVYNEFSSGKQDPMAIREMLRMFRKRTASGDGTTSPRWLLVFGYGSYDNKDLLGKGLPQVLACQSEESFTLEGSSYCTDDLFGYLDDGETGYQNESLEVSIGRLPARSTGEADHLVDKIRRYMQRSDLANADIRGDWRNYITLLADDADPSSPGDTVFARSSENMSRAIAARFPQYNFDKIYADAYRQQSSAIGSYYPDVNNAMRQRMDYGCLLFNYVGHGSVEYIGTERYIELSDIENYSNFDQLALFVTSTCSYGRFDKIEPLSGSERLLNANGGAVGVITATRPIGHIERFNTDICLTALTPGRTIGDALRLAKNATSVSHSFVLLGDPALRLSIPENKVVVTEINGSEVVDGVCDSAEVLSTVTVKGAVVDADGVRLETFNGTVYPIVFDRPETVRTLANDNDGTEVSFSQQNNVIYRGRTAVVDGLFEYKFTVPRDVSSRYANAKLSHFAKTADGDCATGSYGNLMLGGFNADADIDECRPVVKLYINDTNFHNGGLTDENPVLLARLSDKVGINAVGSGIGHNITAVIDGNSSSEITLNDFYETDMDDSRCGTVTYALSRLSPGRHTLALKAWNIYNHSNTATIDFTVRTADSVGLGRCYAYPNPCADLTTLHIEHNNIDTIESVAIDIMSYTGQHVCSLQPVLSEGGYVISAQWNLATDNGMRVANGLYVARIIVRTKDGGKQISHAKIAVK